MTIALYRFELQPIANCAPRLSHWSLCDVSDRLSPHLLLNHREQPRVEVVAESGWIVVGGSNPALTVLHHTTGHRSGAEQSGVQLFGKE